MYHCHIHFYFIGDSHHIFQEIKEISPLEHFTHEFSESVEPECALAAKADVIVADVHETDARGACRR